MVTAQLFKTFFEGSGNTLVQLPERHRSVISTSSLDYVDISRGLYF